MADDMEVPIELYSRVPEDVDGATKLYMRAQVVIQGAFHLSGPSATFAGVSSVRPGNLPDLTSE